MTIPDGKKALEWTALAKSAWAHGLIWWRYQQKAREVSDIHEHLPFLRGLSRSCATICELGVRRCVSSWAFLLGLAESCAQKKKLLCVDIVPADISELKALGRSLKPSIGVTMAVADSRKVILPQDFDLLFLDTLHVYGQLKAELWAHHARVRRYIVLHDTEVDGTTGEVIRMGWDAHQMAQETGMSQADLTRGLRPAVDEFLRAFPDWALEKNFANNNGLTVLVRRES